MKFPLCILCGSRKGKTLLTITEPDRFEKFVGITPKRYKREWVECFCCGLVADVHQKKNYEKLKKIGTAYYEADFQNSTIADKYKKIMSLPHEKSDNAQRVRRIHRFMDDWIARYGANKEHTVLDIGAGIGVFLSRFLEVAPRGVWSGVGVESDPLASAHLRSLERFEVIEGIFPGDFGLKNFSLCTLNKVVEHIEDPVTFLKNVIPALRTDSGIVYVEVPDAMTIFRRPSTDNILGSVHCHLYGMRSLGLLMERVGFVPLQIMRFFEPSGKITVAAFAALPQAVEAITISNR